MVPSKIRLLLSLYLLFAIPSLRAADDEQQPNNLLPVDTQNEGIRWGPLMNQSLFFLGVENGFRLATESFTRRRLGGKFFEDWGASIGNLHGWADGDPFVINYIGHPMEGSVTGYLFVQNDPKYQKTEFGRSRAYWKSRLRATAFSFASSELFELGPLSEASIGNAQQYFPQVGLVDHVITPVVGLGWMITEDWLDRTLIRNVEGRTTNAYVKMFLRSALNPSRSMANAMRLEVPWHRDTRAGIFGGSRTLLAAPKIPEASEASRVLASKSSEPALNDMSGVIVPRYELGTTYSYTQLALGKSGTLGCNGGGATFTYTLKHWVGLTADVGGCKMNSPGTNITGDSTTYLIGPRITFWNQSRWTPFLSFLVGGDKLTTETMFPDLKPANLGKVGVEESAILHSKYTEQHQTNALAIQFGGGVDYQVNRVLAIRIADLQDLHTWARDLNGRHYPNNLRFSTGVALHFGTW